MTIQGQLEQIPGGAPGLRAKIARIRELVASAVRDVDFRQMVVEQLAGVPERDWDGEIRRVQRFVQRIRFTRDPYTPDGLEVFTHPKVMLLQVLGGTAYGDCDDHVLLASAMLEVIGHRVRYRVGGPGPGRYSHIWLDVLHPDRGWTPLELIRDEVPPGWDPSGLFAVTESHRGGDMAGLGTLQKLDTPGGGVSRIAIRNYSGGFGRPLPSDVIRQIKGRERRGGQTVSEMMNRQGDPGGLGWVAATINALVSAASAYSSYETTRREGKRRERNRQALMAQGRSQAEAYALEPAPPPVNYSPFIAGMGQSVTALYSEYAYTDPKAAAKADYERRLRETAASQPGVYGPPVPFEVAYANYRPPPRDWDSAFMERSATAWGYGQGLEAKSDTVIRGYQRLKTEGAGVLDEFIGRGVQLSEGQKQRLLEFLNSYGQNLGALGEDPLDPGDYQPITLPLRMPEGWEKIVDDFRPRDQWDSRWYGDIVALHEAQTAQQDAGEWYRQTVGDSFDIDTYPAVSGASAGKAGWQKHWGSLAMLGESVVKRWFYFFALTHHPRWLAGTAANWLDQLKWILNAIDGAAKAAWFGNESRRKAEWQAKKDAFLRWQRGQAGKDQRDRDAADAKARADAARKAAEDEARRIQEAKLAADAARRAQDALNRARYGSGGPAPGSPGPGPAQGPPPPVQYGPPAPAGISPMIYAAGAAAALWFVMRGRGGKRR